MGFKKSGKVTKLRYGSILAAALAFLMVKQRDSVGLVTFSDSMNSYVPPRSVQSQFNESIKVLSPVKPSGVTVTGDMLHSLAERISVRGLVVIISDLLIATGEFIHALKHFRHNGHEVLIFHVLDPMEVNFDYTSETRFTDMETGRSLTTQPLHIRENYINMQKERFSSLVHAMHDISVDYARFTTDVPFDHALSEYLAKRKRLY